MIWWYDITAKPLVQCNYYLVAGEDGSCFLSFLVVNILIFILIIDIIFVHDFFSHHLSRQWLVQRRQTVTSSNVNYVTVYVIPDCISPRDVIVLGRGLPSVASSLCRRRLVRWRTGTGSINLAQTMNIRFCLLVLSIRNFTLCTNVTLRLSAKPLDHMQ